MLRYVVRNNELLLKMYLSIASPLLGAVKPRQRFLDMILIQNSSYRHINYSFFKSQDKHLSLGKGAEEAFVYVFP